MSSRKNPLRIVVVSSRKGGVGKTTLCSHLGVSLASRRVLLVDLDPRGDLTSNLGIRGGDRRNDFGAALRDTILSGAEPRPVDCCWSEPWADEEPFRIEREGLALLPGGFEMDGFGAFVADRSTPVSLQPIIDYADREGFEFVMIDSPPGDRGIQSLALSVATDLIAPIGDDFNSLRGLVDIAQVSAEAAVTNPRLRFTGALLYRINPIAKLQLREAREDAEAALNGASIVFNNFVRSSIEHARAVRAGLTAGEWFLYQRIHAGVSAAQPVRNLAWDYERLVDELLGLWATQPVVA